MHRLVTLVRYLSGYRRDPWASIIGDPVPYAEILLPDEPARERFRRLAVGDPAMKIVMRDAIAQDLSRGPAILKAVAPDSYEDWDWLRGTAAAWWARGLLRDSGHGAGDRRSPLLVGYRDFSPCGGILCGRQSAAHTWLARMMIARAALSGLVELPALQQAVAAQLNNARGTSG